jgi:hypothetical protein
MSDLLTRAELVKLSRVLGAKEADVAFLAGLGHLELRKLQDRISNALFDEYRGAFQRLADASRLLPASLVAKLSELVFGPVISARVSGLMPPERAIEVATKLKTKFLADVTMQLDPRSASELLAIMPTRIVIEVATLLLERREYVTMGRFVDDLTDEAIRAVTDSLGDDQALVRIGSFVERPERLNELVQLLGADRIKRVVAAVASGPEDLQAAGLAMVSQFTHKQLARFGEAAIALGPKVLNGLIGAAQREGVTEIVTSVMQGIGPEGRAVFAKMLAGMDAATLNAWAQATTEAGLWPAALKILAASSADIQQQAAAALARLDTSAKDAIRKALRAEKLESTLTALQGALA